MAVLAEIAEVMTNADMVIVAANGGYVVYDVVPGPDCQTVYPHVFTDLAQLGAYVVRAFGEKDRENLAQAQIQHQMSEYSRILNRDTESPGGPGE